MVLKPDLYDQLVSFSTLTLLVWSSACKIVPEMTDNVLSGTLMFYTTTYSYCSGPGSKWGDCSTNFPPFCPRLYSWALNIGRTDRRNKKWTMICNDDGQLRRLHEKM